MTPGHQGKYTSLTDVTHGGRIASALDDDVIRRLQAFRERLELVPRHPNPPEPAADSVPERNGFGE
jgi:hypothetical protein